MEIRDLSSHIIKRSEKFAEVVSACSTLLKYNDSAKEIRNYLQDRIPDNVPGFSFGYFPPNDKLDELLKFIDYKDLEYLDLIYKKNVYDGGQAELATCGVLSKHNLIMPYKNVYGDIIGLVGRTLLSKDEMKYRSISKYKNTSLLKSLNLFGLYNAKQNILSKDYAVLVEGQIDCISCHRIGLNNVVALGGSAFTKFHFLLLKRYTNNIYICLDTDDAGRRETKNIIYKYNKLANIIPIIIPDGYKDIDEYIRTHGNVDFLLDNYGQVKK